jgi:hypothetical protein
MLGAGWRKRLKVESSKLKVGRKRRVRHGDDPLWKEMQATPHPPVLAKECGID